MAELMSQTNGDVLVVYFTDARLLDQAQIESVGKGLADMVDKCEQGKLLLNFADVRFMGSAMIGKLVSLNKACKQAGVTLKLSNISKDIMQVFTLTRLDRVLDIHDEEERALAAFQKRGWFR